jgi:hypothetical protein
MKEMKEQFGNLRMGEWENERMLKCLNEGRK